MPGWDEEFLAAHNAKMARLHSSRSQPSNPPIRAAAASAAPISPRGGRKKTPHLPDPSEDEIQKAAAAFLEIALPPPLRFLHIPNGGTRDYGEAAKLKAMGVKAGAADIMILGWRTFIWIEMKSRTGRLRPEQKEWRDWCHSIGAPWFLCRSVSDVAEALASLQIRLNGRLT